MLSPLRLHCLSPNCMPADADHSQSQSCPPSSHHSDLSDLPHLPFLYSELSSWAFPAAHILWALNESLLSGGSKSWLPGVFSLWSKIYMFLPFRTSLPARCCLLPVDGQ